MKNNGDEGLARELWENDEPLPPVDYDKLSEILMPAFQKLKAGTYSSKEWEQDKALLNGVTTDRDAWCNIEDAVRAAGIL